MLRWWHVSSSEQAASSSAPVARRVTPGYGGRHRPPLLSAPCSELGVGVVAQGDGGICGPVALGDQARDGPGQRGALAATRLNPPLLQRNQPQKLSQAACCVFVVLGVRAQRLVEVELVQLAHVDALGA